MQISSLPKLKLSDRLAQLIIVDHRLIWREERIRAAALQHEQS